VQRVDRLAGEPVEQALLHHLPCAAAAFFGRLEDEGDGAVEIAHACKVARCAEQHGRVAVVSARVVHTRMPADVGDFASLVDRKRVHVGAKPDHPVRRAMAQHADHARSRNAFVHFEPELLQCGGHEPRGAAFLEGQFGMGMQVAPEGHEVWNEVGDFVLVACRVHLERNPRLAGASRARTNLPPHTMPPSPPKTAVLTNRRRIIATQRSARGAPMPAGTSQNRRQTWNMTSNWQA
jgi:hypothetical protein